jgi:hypothetical protein
MAVSLMSDQDKIYAALRESRLYDLPRELLVMLIENITKLNRDMFMQEMVHVREGTIMRSDLEHDVLVGRGIRACNCHRVVCDDFHNLLRCTDCETLLCGDCTSYCMLCKHHDDRYCSNCTKEYDHFGCLCQEHAIANVRRE